MVTLDTREKGASWRRPPVSRLCHSAITSVHIAVPHDEIPESVTLDKTKAISIIKLVLIWPLVVDLSKVISRCFDSQMNGEFFFFFFF